MQDFSEKGEQNCEAHDSHCQTQTMKKKKKNTLLVIAKIKKME